MVMTVPARQPASDTVLSLTLMMVCDTHVTFGRFAHQRWLVTSTGTRSSGRVAQVAHGAAPWTSGDSSSIQTGDLLDHTIGWWAVGTRGDRLGLIDRWPGSERRQPAAGQATGNAVD